MGSLPANAGARIVVIDPSNPERVYAAGDQGVFRSDDAGQTWQAVDGGLPTGGVTALALEPRQPHQLYAVTATNGLYRSDDGGGSWQVLAGTETGAHP